MKLLMEMVWIMVNGYDHSEHLLLEIGPFLLRILLCGYRLRVGERYLLNWDLGRIIGCSFIMEIVRISINCYHQGEVFS
jgi:hypothetical protein